MAPFVRGSIFKTFVSVVSCLLAAGVPVPLALAQHAPGRIAAGGTHVSAPPISHTPISPPPILHLPISHTPISAPRIPAATPAGVLGTTSFHPPRGPIRPFPRMFRVYAFPFGAPFWGFNSCWSSTCDVFWPTFGSFSDYGPANYLSTQVLETPVYVYGEERPDLPQLYLKDGTIVNVTDYWVVDDQLHFTMIEEDGAKPKEQVIPFDALDLQKTVDVNTQRGFRFVLRNEPFEQYLRDHPDVTPPVVAPAHK
jgi:hypothetical protein